MIRTLKRCPSGRLLLHVTSSRYVAGAVWCKTADGWRCERAAPILAWMVGTGPATARRRLERERVSYEWTEIEDKV